MENDTRIIDLNVNELNDIISSKMDTRFNDLINNLGVLLKSNYPELLSIEDAASFFKVKIATIRKWIRNGDLTTLVIANKRFVEIKEAVRKAKEKQLEYKLN